MWTSAFCIMNKEGIDKIKWVGIGVVACIIGQFILRILYMYGIMFVG